MTKPNQHLPHGILIEYVNGHASEAVALAVACHATLCGLCQHRIAALEAVAGAALETAPGLPLREGLLANVLSRLDAKQTTDDPAPSSAASAPVAALRLPRPLLRYLDRGAGCDGSSCYQVSMSPGFASAPVYQPTSMLGS